MAGAVPALAVSACAWGDAHRCNLCSCVRRCLCLCVHFNVRLSRHATLALWQVSTAVRGPQRVVLHVCLHVWTAAGPRDRQATLERGLTPGRAGVRTDTHLTNPAELVGALKMS